MKPRKIFAHWSQVREELYATINLFEDSELSFMPYNGSWSAGQIMLHIASAEEGWLRYVVTRDLPAWPDHYKIENYPTRKDIIYALDDVYTWTQGYIKGLDETDLDRLIETPWGEHITLGWILWHVVEHEIHHRGELSLILGILGREGLDV